jgi:concanavalin A-like lectin/glucanase superfamily protein/FecR-like protein
LSDGTRLDLDEDTVLRIGEGGKRLFLARGSLQAEVTKQSRGSALVFETPYGEATVLGTILRLAVVRGTTRLEVLEGRVRLSGENAKSVDVAAGQFAVSAAGTELKAKPILDPRVTEGLRALYVFEEGKGRVIRDVSGVGTPLHLVAKDENDLSWIPGGGLSLRSPTLVASSGPATKIVGACRSSRAITVEAWIRPAQVERGTLRYVVALSGPRKESLAYGLGLHAEVGNGPTTYRAYLTTPKTSPTSDLMPDLESSPIVPGLAHIVFTRSASGIATLYVDGQERASGTVDGDFSTWSDPLRLMLGDYSFEGVRPWLGDFHLLAFYSRALKPEEVAQNLSAGKRKLSTKK